MSRSTISVFKLSEMFPNEESARQYIETHRWPKGPVCPVCKGSDRITVRKGGYYRCNYGCGDFTVRTGTIFERSHVPLHKWLHVMYRVLTARKGISSMQLAKEIGVTQKTSWFVLHRIREACGNDMTVLKGIVEMDETYIGGLEKNKHEKDKSHIGRGTVGKTPVIGMRERGGRTKAIKVDDVNSLTVLTAIRENIELGSTIHTDENSAYLAINLDEYNHKAINHKAGEYSRHGVSTNGIESVWAVLNRGIHGIFHHVESKHLSRYVSEFAFRLNDGDVKRHTLDRLSSMIEVSFGARITYKDLTRN